MFCEGKRESHAGGKKDGLDGLSFDSTAKVHRQGIATVERIPTATPDLLDRG